MCSKKNNGGLTDAKLTDGKLTSSSPPVDHFDSDRKSFSVMPRGSLTEIIEKQSVKTEFSCKHPPPVFVRHKQNQLCLTHEKKANVK